MTSLSRTPLATLAAALALAALVPALAEEPAGEAALRARAFEVRYRPLTDAADLVGSVLSVDGVVTLKPRLKVLVVEDRPAVLERVASLLASFDLPPRNVEVTLNLFLGTERLPEDAPSAEGRKLIDLPPLQFTKWTSYESLGSRSVNGVEGDEVVTDLSDDYRVVFLVEDVDERQGVVRFKRLSLQQLSQTPEGLRVRNLYSASAVVESGKQLVFGAAKDPEASNALFLMVKALVR